MVGLSLVSGEKANTFMRREVSYSTDHDTITVRQSGQLLPREPFARSKGSFGLANFAAEFMLNVWPFYQMMKTPAEARSG